MESGDIHNASDAELIKTAKRNGIDLDDYEG